jgi:hypothetical protein
VNRRERRSMKFKGRGCSSAKRMHHVTARTWVNAIPDLLMGSFWKQRRAS